MNQAISNVFPKLLEKTQKNPKKSLDLAETNPISKKNYKIIFWQKEEREGVINEFLDDFNPKICAYKVM